MKIKLKRRPGAGRKSNASKGLGKAITTTLCMPAPALQALNELRGTVPLGQWLILKLGLPGPKTDQIQNDDLSLRAVKQSAVFEVKKALHDGRLVRPDHCSCCGAGHLRIEGHHEDYSRVLDVVWLCRPCHRLRHAVLRMAKKRRFDPKTVPFKPVLLQNIHTLFSS